MDKASLFLIFALATVAVFSVQVAADEDDAPPMYAVHDYASGELQKRRVIQADKPCDAEFGTELEAIVTKMEKNKDENEEFANNLRKQFEDLMNKNKEKKLCEKLTWCDMGVCRKRVKIQSRQAAGSGDAASPAPPGSGTGDNSTNTDTAIVSTTTTTTAKPDTSSAVSVFSTFCRWAVLTLIATVIPRNL